MATAKVHQLCTTYDKEDGASRPDSLRQASIVYLACPYTHSDPLIRNWRFAMATSAAATLIKRGFIVFSPITMTHPLDVVLAGEETLGSDFWVRFDEAFMEKCSEIMVLRIAGWNESSGVKREIEFFRQKGSQVAFMDPSELETLFPPHPHCSTFAREA